MSTFCLKAIALLVMTIDHLGLVLGTEGWQLLPFPSFYLRAVGRIAFPLFAYCLAQGWHRTHNRKQYFRNILWGAVVSQIPFSMAFYWPNLTQTSISTLQIQFSSPYLFFAAVAVVGYWYAVLQKRWDRSLLVAAVAALLPGLRIQIQDFWILCENTNVFYTFLVAFFCLYVLEHRYDFSPSQRIAWCFAGAVLLVAYGLPADYGTGLLGVVLIVGFAIFPGKKQQIALLILWSALFYGVLVGSWVYALFCTVAAAGVLLYNPYAKTRIRAKKLFYWYYPVHLLLLGFFNLFMRLR